MTTNAVMKQANVIRVVSIKNIMLKCGVRECWVAEITGDPELEPWFLIECGEYSDEPPRWQIDKIMVVTKDGESCHVVLHDNFLGPKGYFLPNEQPIIQEAIKRYVKQQVE